MTIGTETTKAGAAKTGTAKTGTAKTGTAKKGKVRPETVPDEETRPEDPARTEDDARTEEAAEAEEESAEATEESAAEDVHEDPAEDAPRPDDEAAAKAEKAPTPRDGPGGRRGTRLAGRMLSAGRRVSSVHRSRAGVVLVLLALVAATVTAALQWREADRLAQEADTRRQVGARAAEFGQALLAYEHTDLDGSRTRIRRLTATDFGRSYEAAFDGLAAVIGKYKADATATVRDTYVNEIEGDRAKALVVLDSEVRSTAGTRRVMGSKLLLELVREKGQWRVSGLASLEADHESMTEPDGTPASPGPSEGDPAVPGSPDKP